MLATWILCFLLPRDLKLFMLNLDANTLNENMRELPGEQSPPSISDIVSRKVGLNYVSVLYFFSLFSPMSASACVLCVYSSRKY